VQKKAVMRMGINEDIAVILDGKVQEMVRQYKYFGATITVDARSN